MTTPGPGPRSGDNTYALTGDALAAPAERRGAWAGDDLTAITLIASLTGQAERFLPELATSAPLNGPAWGPDRCRAGHQPRAGAAAESPVADTRWPYRL